MNALIFVFGLLISAGAQASDLVFACHDRNGNEAVLTIREGSLIHWNEPWHSSSSPGDFAGKEMAPFSSWKGYSLYKLRNFYQTNDSAFYLAIETLSAPFFKAVVFYDNDDHAEEITRYRCSRVSN